MRRGQLDSAEFYRWWYAARVEQAGTQNDDGGVSGQEPQAGTGMESRRVPVSWEIAARNGARGDLIALEQFTLAVESAGWSPDRSHHSTTEENIMPSRRTELDRVGAYNFSVEIQRRQRRVLQSQSAVSAPNWKYSNFRTATIYSCANGLAAPNSAM